MLCLLRGARTLALGVAALVLPFVSACATAGGPPIQQIADTINATLFVGETTIVPGDLLDVHFTYSASFNQEILVQSDGAASFLIVAPMKVVGLVPSELTERLKAAYKGLLDNPDLTVRIKTSAARSVSVLGEVKSPGAIPIAPDGRLTLVESIARAGGHLKETAYLSNTVLVRWDAAAKKQVAWTVDARPEHWASSKTIFLQPYDVVFIPNTPIDNVAIWVENHLTRIIPLPVVLPFVF